MRRIYLPSLAEIARCSLRVHPNGFIQVDLDHRHRLHVFHPRLPYRQRTYNPVHDHVFGFVSEVFSGRLVNACYSVVEDESHGTHCKAHCQGGDRVVVQRGRYYRLRSRASFALQPGQQYEMPAFEFHESLSNEPTMTIIRKDDDTVAQGNPRSATVMTPRGVDPDDDFNRDDVDLEVLWELIEEAYPS